MTEFKLSSKEKAIEKYSNQGLWLLTVNIWYDGFKITDENDDYMWGIFHKRNAITQYAKQKIAAKSSSITHKFDEETYSGSSIRTPWLTCLPEKATWKFIDNGNLAECVFEIEIHQI